MRIHFANTRLNLPSNALMQTLTKLLAEHEVLRGVVRRVTASSILVSLGDRNVEVEIPLEKHSLIEGQVVKITRLGEQSIAIKVIPDQPSVELQTSRQLEQVLIELNIPPTEDAVHVAQGLIERGFPLQETLVWSLLRLAEEGQLEEAFLALQAKFPLKPELLATIRQLQVRDVHEPILREARGEIPLDLQRIFERPSIDNRRSWSNRLSEGEVFKTLVRLLVEERFVEALLDRQGDPNQSSYVFALPFLRENDLYAAWVRISGEGSKPDSGDGEDVNFRVEFEIPTASLGMVGAELVVAGRTVQVTLRAEEYPERIKGALDELEQELGAAGWNIKALQVRGWNDAQSSSFTL